jgi:hypothetical protein
MEPWLVRLVRTGPLRADGDRMDESVALVEVSFQVAA